MDRLQSHLSGLVSNSHELRVDRYESHTGIAELQHCRRQLCAAQFQFEPACRLGFPQDLDRPAQEPEGSRLIVLFHFKGNASEPLAINDQHTISSFGDHLGATAD
jgi:hypothetical protein